MAPLGSSSDWRCGGWGGDKVVYQRGGVATAGRTGVSQADLTDIQTLVIAVVA